MIFGASIPEEATLVSVPCWWAVQKVLPFHRSPSRGFNLFRLAGPFAVAALLGIVLAPAARAQDDLRLETKVLGQNSWLVKSNASLRSSAARSLRPTRSGCSHSSTTLANSTVGIRLRSKTLSTRFTMKR